MKKVDLSANVLFSGIGAQEKGIINTNLFNLNVVSTSDINKEAVVMYAAIHCGLTNELIDNYDYPTREQMAQDLTDINLGYVPEKDKKFDWFKLVKRKKNDLEKYWLACKLSNNLGDISKLKELPYADLWTISFCCFVEGTLVLTNNGYKPIEDISVGDYVLTHNNQYKKVTQTMTNSANKLYKISTIPSENIHCTENHPFYIRKRYRKWNNVKKGYDRLFQEPEWVEAKNLTKDCYVGTAINTTEELPKWNGTTLYSHNSNTLTSKFNNPDFWYIIGRYLGDGWIRSQSGIIICANDEELYQITPYLERLNFGYNIVKRRTDNEIHIPFKEIGDYCLQFGRGAANKHLTKDILNLPVNLLKSFIEGYVAADGTIGKNNLIKITSVSRNLMYEVSQCVNKVYHRPCSIYFSLRPKTTIIEGRVVNQKDTYQLTFKTEDNSQDKAFYDSGYIWSPINEVKEEEYDGLVYNIEVEDDHSYMIQNIIVHNCQDISVAGKMKGLSPDSGTRSSLLWENIKLLKESVNKGESPKYLMFENVKNLVGKKFIDDFNKLVDVLSDLGFNTYWEIINSKDCGVPQNRQRVFAIGVRKDIDKGQLTFPKPFDTGIRLKDILEDEVDEKYYINTDRAQELIKNLVESKKLEHLVGNNKQDRLGGLWDGEKRHQAGSVYNPLCISPTVDTAQGGGREPHIIENKDVIIYDDYNSKITKDQSNIGTLTTNISSPTLRNGIKLIENNNADYRIRKLTVRECFKLMGFSFEDWDKCSDLGMSNSSGYKAAGNSIVTDCVKLIFEHIYKAQYDSSYICFDEHFDESSRSFKPQLMGGIGEEKSNGGSQYYQQDRVYSSGDIGMYHTAQIPGGSYLYLVDEHNIDSTNEIAKIDVPQEVKVRVYDVDIKKLQNTLRQSKQNKGISNKQIAEKLNQPLTLVEHWFRTDASASIPSENIWMELKELLNIETDEFDKSIMTFEYRKGVYEKSDRCYCDFGVAPTLTAVSSDEKIILTNGKDENFPQA